MQAMILGDSSTLLHIYVIKERRGLGRSRAVIIDGSKYTTHAPQKRTAATPNVNYFFVLECVGKDMYTRRARRWLFQLGRMSLFDIILPGGAV